MPRFFLSLRLLPLSKRWSYWRKLTDATIFPLASPSPSIKKESYWRNSTDLWLCSTLVHLHNLEWL
jgi:hypothetical protein